MAVKDYALIIMKTCIFGKKYSRKLLPSHFDISQNYPRETQRFLHSPQSATDKGLEMENEDWKNIDLGIKIYMTGYNHNVCVRIHTYGVGGVLEG